MKVYHRQHNQGHSRNLLRWWHILVPRSSVLNEETMVLIGLGSSLGARHHHLQKGLLLMAHDPWIELVHTSSVWQTLPIGAAKNAFYNMCVIIKTRYSPSELMSRLLDIEKRCARLRGVHWMDRTLDLDVLLYGDHTVDESIIQVPHPRMLERSFVMQPAQEIASDWIHPVKGRSIESLTKTFESGMWKVGCFSIAHKN